MKNELFELEKRGITIFDRFVLDSRKVEKDDVFLAIRKGNDFVEEALSKGAKVIYDSKEINIENKNALRVGNTINFTQELAKYKIDKLKPLVVGITGSNGKTTTKDFLFGVVSKKYLTERTKGNFNNHIGLPFTILNMKKDTEVLILEMGMSSPGEIGLLSSICRPYYSIITNIGVSHIEFFEDRSEIFLAKSEILEYTKEKVFVNGDDEYLKNIKNSIKVGFDINNEYKAKDICIEESKSNFKIEIEGIDEEFEINIEGEHNILDSIFAIAIGLELEVKMNDIKEALKNIEYTPMRFQKIKKGNTLYINDAYNASPDSMKFSIKTFEKIYKKDRKVLVLGDMLELGEKSDSYHIELEELLANLKKDLIILYGEKMKVLYDRISKDFNVYHFEKKRDIKDMINSIGDEKVVLLKGSRGMKLEEIIEL